MNGRPSPDLPLVGTGVGDHETVSDPSLRPGPGWVGSRRETGGRDPTGTDIQKVTQDGKVTGRVGSAGPTGPPLCAALVSMQSGPHPDLQAHPHVPDSLPKGEVFSRAHLVLREGSQPAWGSDIVTPLTPNGGGNVGSLKREDRT